MTLKEEPKYIAGDGTGLVVGDMTDDITGVWLDMTGQNHASFHLHWSSEALTVGTFTFEGAGSEALQAEPVVLTISTVHGSALVTVADTEGQSIVNINNCPKFVRLVYTFSAGGTATQLDVATQTRSS